MQYLFMWSIKTSMKKTKNGFGSDRIDFHKHKQDLESHMSSIPGPAEIAT